MISCSKPTNSVNSKAIADLLSLLLQDLIVLLLIGFVKEWEHFEPIHSFKLFELVVCHHYLWKSPENIKLFSRDFFICKVTVVVGVNFGPERHSATLASTTWNSINRIIDFTSFSYSRNLSIPVVNNFPGQIRCININSFEGSMIEPSLISSIWSVIRHKNHPLESFIYSLTSFLHYSIELTLIEVDVIVIITVVDAKDMDWNTTTSMCLK